MPSICPENSAAMAVEASFISRKVTRSSLGMSGSKYSVLASSSIASFSRQETNLNGPVPTGLRP